MHPLFENDISLADCEWQEMERLLFFIIDVCNMSFINEQHSMLSQSFALFSFRYIRIEIQNLNITNHKFNSNFWMKIKIFIPFHSEN